MESSSRRPQIKIENTSGWKSSGASDNITRHAGHTTSSPTPLHFTSGNRPPPNRPFSPSALAAESGKRIKAFFKHRISADYEGPRDATMSTFSLRRMSSRISSDSVYEKKDGRERDLPAPPIMASSRSGKQPVPTSNVKPSKSIDHHAKDAVEGRLRFPGTEREDKQSINHHQGDTVGGPRKPKRSLSLFRSASKTNPMAEVSGSEMSRRSNYARVAPDTAKNQRPVSAPVSRAQRPLTSMKPAVDQIGMEKRMMESSADRISLQHHHILKAQSTNTPVVDLDTSSKRSHSPSRASTKPIHAAPNTKFRLSEGNQIEPKQPDPSFYSLSPDAAMSSPSSRTSTPTGREADLDLDREAHYLLRMASTYLAKTVMLEVKVAKTKVSMNQQVRIPADSTDVLRRHVYEKIKILERMERSWGIEWMLRGKEGFAVSVSRKEKERDCFRRVVEDGVVLCFLLLRLETTRSPSGSGILLSISGASKHNLSLVANMAKTLPLTCEDIRLPEAIEHLGDRGVYAAAQLIVALARLAGPQRKETLTDDLDLSNPASDCEDQQSEPDLKPRITAPGNKRLLERPPLLIRRISSKTSTSGATTPKQLAPLQLSSTCDAPAEVSLVEAIQPISSKERSADTRFVPGPSESTRRLPRINAEGDFRLPMRRPILRVKQSFASSVTSENTSTADSKSRASGRRPRFIPENREDDIASGSEDSVPPLNPGVLGSPSRAVSFGLSDEHAQLQVKSFRSSIRYPFTAANPPFSRESSTSENAVGGEEDEFPLEAFMQQREFRVSRVPSLTSQRFSSEINSSSTSALSSPSRQLKLQTKVQVPPRPLSPNQSRLSRPASVVSIGVSSAGQFPGTPPRTPRNQFGIWPQSSGGSRRTSFASTTGESPSSRLSRQTIEVVISGKRKATYQIGNCIGKGQFGMVFRALDLSSGQFVAIKRIDIKGTGYEEVRQIMREVDLLQRLRHPGIVRYLGMAKSEEYLDIVLEFIEGGSLAHSVKSFGELNEDLVSGYVAKILEGLDYLHSQDVVHCDLKSSNILNTKTGNIKLSDFGVSLNLRTVGQSKDDVVGSPHWMAPEVIELKGITTAADIWSLGATIIELITGRPPYYDMDNGMAVMYRIVDEGMVIPEHCSAGLTDFLTKCFQRDPKNRPTAADLFEHEWVKSRVSLDPKLRHQDSIPFLRRISTDACKLHAKSIFTDNQAVAKQGIHAQEGALGQHNEPPQRKTPDERTPSKSPQTSARVSFPPQVSTANDERLANVETADQYLSAPARQLAFEKLVGSHRVQAKTEERPQLFRLSSRNSAGPSLPTAAPTRNPSSSEASILPKNPTTAQARLGSLSISPESSSFLFSHDPEKPLQDVKTDCSLM